MRLIVDTTPIIAQVEPDHPGRAPAAAVLEGESRLPMLSPATIAEIDYFLQKKRGPHGNATFISDLAAGRFEIAHLDVADFVEIDRLNRRYRDLSPGIADLSIVVLAARYRTTRILTFDQKHFRLLRPLQGGTFTLLPFDEDVT